jgi:hypothetical protein
MLSPLNRHSIISPPSHFANLLHACRSIVERALVCFEGNVGFSRNLSIVAGKAASLLGSSTEVDMMRGNLRNIVKVFNRG